MVNSSFLKLSVWFILILIVTYFLLPKSMAFIVGGDFREFSLYLKPWYIQRYLIIGLLFLYTFLSLCYFRIKFNINHSIIFVFILLFSFVQIFHSGVVVFYAAFGALGAYILVNYANDFYLTPFKKKIVIISLLVYVSYFIFHRTGGRVTGSFLDPNISGYYLFLAYIFFRLTGYKVFSVLVLIVGFFTFSRNFYLAIMIFEFFKLDPVSKLLKGRMILNPAFLCIVSVFIVLATSFSIVKLSDHAETIGGTSARLTNLNDGSNYSRANANVEFVERIASGEFIIFGNGSEVDSETTHRPHNAFLRAIYRYGLIVSFLCFIVFFYVSKNLLLNHVPAYLALYSYYSILNDFITGSELVLTVSIFILIESFNKERLDAKSYS